MPATVTPPATARPGDRVALVCLDTYAGRYELAQVDAPREADDREPIGTVGRVLILQDGSTVLELDWMRHEDAGRIGRRWPLALTVPASALDLPGIACPECAGPTIAPTPGRPEEVGDYCEQCGRAWDRAAVLADRPELAGPLSGLTVTEMAAELAESAEEMAADDAAGAAMHAEPVGPGAVIDALRVVGARLADIRAELEEIADALGPDTFAGGAAARAFHALAPLRLSTSAGYAATCTVCGAHADHADHQAAACPLFVTPHRSSCPHA